VDLRGEALLSCRAGYYGLINHMDDQIRRLINGIDGGVSLRDTVIIYAADHGEMLGDHHLFGKCVPFEGAAHIPMLIRGTPAMGLPAHQVCDAPVCLEDIMPTVLDLVGIRSPEGLDGRSLLPFLRGETQPWRDAVMIENETARPGNKMTSRCLTDGKSKYVRYEDDRELFFDLTADPQELVNLADHSEAAERIADWRRKMDTETWLLDRL
jgi:arylsulfatase A-like enzyme